MNVLSIRSDHIHQSQQIRFMRHRIPTDLDGKRKTELGKVNARCGSSGHAIGWRQVNKLCYWLAGFVYLSPTNTRPAWYKVSTCRKTLYRMKTGHVPFSFDIRSFDMQKPCTKQAWYWLAKGKQTLLTNNRVCLLVANQQHVPMNHIAR